MLWITAGAAHQPGRATTIRGKGGFGMAKKALEHRFHEEEMKRKLGEMEKGGDYPVAGQTDIADGVIGAVAATAAGEVDGVIVWSPKDL
jgi:hypothetical protein